MKCPFQTVTTVKTIKAYAIGNEDAQVVKQSFIDCLKEECPCYVPERHFPGGIYTNEYCKKVASEQKNITSEAPAAISADPVTYKLMESAGYNDHDGCFEKCPYCGEVYNSYERIAMKLNNEEPFECRKCGKIIAFRP